MLPRMAPGRARDVVRGVAGLGMLIGAGSLGVPRLGLRAVGLEAEGRGVTFMARLFGCRDLVLCAGLLRVASERRVDLRWIDVLAVMQAGDIALTVAMYRSGGLSRRGLAVVLGSASPTLVALVVARRGLAAT
ncbi:MAG TPA: hypothetical protein VF112_03435 [Candidatus Dormibacteraeota bacterium]